MSKLARFHSHSTFLRDCRDQHLIPLGLRLNIKLTSAGEAKWKKKAEETRLCLVFNQARSETFKTKARLQGIKTSLIRRGASEAAISLLERKGQDIYSRTSRKSEAIKARKFHGLLVDNGGLSFRNKHPRRLDTSATTVINLTSRPLTTEETSVLQLGAKFAIAPSKPPVLELALKSQLASDIAIKRADQLGVTGDDIATFLNKAETILTRTSNQPQPKPPGSIAQSLKILAKDDSKVIVPADKAKALVVIEKADYTTALLRSLQSPIYEEVASDPAVTFAGKFNDHLLTALAGPAVRGKRRDKVLKETDEEAYKLYRRLSKTHGRCGPFYGLVKTHKYSAPPTTEEDRLFWISSLKLRPICPAHRGADYELTKHLTACLKVLPRPAHSITSPLQVLDMLHSMGHATNNCRLISLDVEAMFPSIPTQQAIYLIRELLQEHRDALSDVTCLKPDAVADLLAISIQNCHAVIQDGERARWFRQTTGLAMGKSYSPVVADLYMGTWERDLEHLAATCGGRVYAFCRYADDYLVLFEGGDDVINEWVNCLNTKDPNIKVTTDIEEKRQLPFLDIQITRGQDKFTTKVYRKACATNQVPAFNTYTETRYLRSAIRSDCIRAIRYCSTNKDRQREFDFIRQKFHQHNYPHHLIDSTIQKTQADLQLKARALPAPAGSGLQPAPVRISVPFAGSCFYQLKRAASKIGIQLVSKPPLTVGSVLCSKAKHHLPQLQESNVIYLIECSCKVEDQPVVYIGETDRELGTRVREHRESWTGSVHSKANASAFSTHRDCTPSFDSTKILNRATHHQMRLLLESAYIRTVGRREAVLVSPNDANVNRNSSALLQDRWLPIIRRFCYH